MKSLCQLSLVTVVLVMAGCTLFLAKETRYLQSAQDRATQEEVLKWLGTPRLTAATPDGESLWVYQIYEIAPGGQDTWSTRGSWCDEYVLTFDMEHILRHWTHRSQVHGGELMPTYCVRDDFKMES
jgi:hypothetical protein